MLKDQEAAALQARTDGRRFLELDALRGLTAITVVAGHSRYMLHDYPGSRLLLPLFAGGQAVILFFVLSGFVLSLSYWRGTAPNYSTFTISRIIRIYFPYLAAVALSIIADALLHHHSHPSFNAWGNGFFTTPITAGFIARQLYMSAHQDFNASCGRCPSRWRDRWSYRGSSFLCAGAAVR